MPTGQGGDKAKISTKLPSLRWLSIIALLLATGTAQLMGQPATVTTCSMAHRLKAEPVLGLHPIQLEGTVYYADAASGYLVLGDGADFADFEVELNQERLRFGDRVRLEGVAELGGSRSRLRRAPVVENDGLHGDELRTGQVYLAPGHHRVELQYFQAFGSQTLSVAWSGPGVLRQILPGAALLQRGRDDMVVPEKPKPGLQFSQYSGQWDRLPDFDKIRATKTGVASSCDPGVAQLPTHYALLFTAWLPITNGGTYTFEVTSDDGSRLLLDPISPTITPLGRGVVPPARQWDDGQVLATDSDEFVELEGIPHFVGLGPATTRIQLKRGAQSIEALVSNTTQWHPALLSNSRLRLRGVLQATLDVEAGQPGYRLLVDGDSGWRGVFPQDSLWRLLPTMPVRALAGREDLSPLVHLTGTVRRSETNFFVLADETGDVTVRQRHEAELATGTSLEVLGRIRREGQRSEVIGAVYRPVPVAANVASLVLTSLEQVHHLPRSTVQGGAPVDVTAVAVLSAGTWLFFRDSSRSIYCTPPWPEAKPPIVGEVYRIHGQTAADQDSHTPFLHPLKASLLGTAALPEPLRPSWDELMTGRFDAQWIEVSGMISLLSTNLFLLTTAEGQMRAQLLSGVLHPAELEGAMVRVRGCCSVNTAGSGRITSIYMLVQSGEFIDAMVPAPVDPFALPLRPIGSLLAYDADGGLLRYVRIAGVLVHSGEPVSFLSDGTSGVRFVTKKPEDLTLGQAIEVVGVLDVSAQFPRVTAATVKRVGQGQLPPPVAPSPEELSSGRWDASLIRLQGTLLSVMTNSVEQIFEVHVRDRVVPARLSARAGIVPNVRPGSQVELVGVCNGRYAKDISTRGFDNFELLLASPGAVRVLRAPSWWSARHTVTVLGGLLGVILLAGSWITSLRRRVDLRTHQLQLEIEQHKRTEAMLTQEMGERQRMQQQVERTHQDLMVASRQAGMAEVASSVLHNVGNVLNSVGVSTGLLTQGLRKSRVSNLAKVVQLMRTHEHDLGNFVTNDPRGKELPHYLGLLSSQLASEQAAALEELGSLRKSVEHISHIVVMQQSYATTSGVVERVHLRDVMEDAVRLDSNTLPRQILQIIREYDPTLPEITVDRHKVLHILVHLIRNAAYACAESGKADQQLTLRLVNGPTAVQAIVADNGVGIAPPDLPRLFHQGFTTKKGGHGYGLHSGALAAKEMGGSLTATSPGLGRGASFTLQLPHQPPTLISSPAPSPGSPNLNP